MVSGRILELSWIQFVQSFSSAISRVYQSDLRQTVLPEQVWSRRIWIELDNEQTFRSPAHSVPNIRRKPPKAGRYGRPVKPERTRSSSYRRVGAHV